MKLCKSYLKEVNDSKNDVEQKLRILQDQLTIAIEELITKKINAAEGVKNKMEAGQRGFNVILKCVQQVSIPISTFRKTFQRSEKAIRKYDGSIKKYDEHIKKDNEVIESTEENANAHEQQLDELKTRMQEADRKLESTLEGYTATIDRTTAPEKVMGRYSEGGQSSQSEIRRLEDPVTRYEFLTSPQAPSREEVIGNLQEQDPKAFPAVRTTLKDAEEKISTEQDEVRERYIQLQDLQKRYDDLSRKLEGCQIHGAVSDGKAVGTEKSE